MTQEPLACKKQVRYPAPRTGMSLNSIKIEIHERSEELPPCSDRRDIISLMAHELADIQYPKQAHDLEISALERENVESTYVGRGLAIPHARVEGLQSAAVYIARRKQGLAWAKEVADTVILLAVPEEQPDVYLHLLSKLMRWRMKGLSMAQLREIVAQD